MSFISLRGTGLLQERPGEKGDHLDTCLLLTSRRDGAGRLELQKGSEPKGEEKGDNLAGSGALSPPAAPGQNAKRGAGRKQG